MALKNQILTTIQPKVALKELSVFDTNQLEVNNLEPQGPFNESPKDSVGVASPLIMVNGRKLEPGIIMNMVLRQDSFLPKLKITFVDRFALFSSYNNPIFDPIVSVYVKAQTANLKPLRGDYLIQNITSTPIMGEAEHIITLDCELYIPKLYDNVSNSYPNMSSVDCLKKIAQELELGFATNEDTMNDKMTWLNPNLSYISFIKDEVVKRSYKSDNSFFTCFIDRYYILNFVNVEKQMEQDKEFDMSYYASDIITNGSAIKESDARDKETEVIAQVCMSNHPSMQNNANYIREFWPISNNGEILKTQSFRNRMLWYGTEDEKVNSFFIEPISNSKTLNGSVHQIPSIEGLKKMEVKKWLGFDYGNSHKHSKFAIMLNHHNNLELSKNMICARVYGFNSTLLRGTRVPVIFYDETYVNSIKRTLENKSDSITDTRSYNYHMDEILSDIYYIKDIVYKYDSVSGNQTNFYTEFILSKRNWKKTSYNNV